MKTEDYPLNSRIHPLKIGAAYGIECYIKRDDELGCLLSGSKVRKYRTQVSSLKEKGYKRVGLIGSGHSNHVLGLSSLLIESGIEPHLFLLESKQEVLQGNALFTRLFVPKENIYTIPRSEWSQSEAIAKEHVPYVVSEGGCLEDSVHGLKTLGSEIEQHPINFKEILIDSGSGLTAATLLCTITEAHVHIMLAASTEDAFLQTLEEAKKVLKPKSLPPFTLHFPTSAKSFGSTNQKVFQTIGEVAQKEGVLLDPIYSAKLYLLLEDLLERRELRGPVLFIHSGGVFSLCGFQEKVRAQLE